METVEIVVGRMRRIRRVGARESQTLRNRRLVAVGQTRVARRRMHWFAARRQNPHSARPRTHRFSACPRTHRIPQFEWRRMRQSPQSVQQMTLVERILQTRGRRKRQWMVGRTSQPQVLRRRTPHHSPLRRQNRRPWLLRRRTRRWAWRR